MKIKNETLLSHGGGETPLRAFSVQTKNFTFRASWGGYGYVKRPFGSWALIPRFRDDYGVYSVSFLAGSIRLIPDRMKMNLSTLNYLRAVKEMIFSILFACFVGFALYFAFVIGSN